MEITRRKVTRRLIVLLGSVLLLFTLAPGPMNFASTPTLQALDITWPIQGDPAYAGPHHSPRKVVIHTTKPADGLQKGDFTVEIGGEPARVVVLWEGSSEYVLEVRPPDSLGADGLYDLTVSAAGESDTEVEAIKYAPAQNVDVVLTLDRSGSMSGATNIPGVRKIDAAKAAASAFTNLMLDGDKLGLVSFSTTPTLNHPLETVTDAVRQAIIAAIAPMQPGNLTTIGGALDLAQDELERVNAAQDPWAIVLLSDGKQTASPWWEDVLPRIEQTKTAVHTIGLGADFNEAALLEIALRTGGTYSYAPDASQLQRIYNTIAGTVRNQQTLLALSGNISLGGRTSRTVVIDSTVAEALFSLGWNLTNSALQVTLERPDGSLLDPAAAAANPHVHHASGPTHAYYRVQHPQVGQWTIHIGSGVSPTTQGANAAQANADTYSLVVNGQTDLTLRLYADQTTYPTADFVRLSATLAATQPITIAHVVGVGTGPDGSRYTFNLFDDGAHQDRAAADGVYAGVYPKTYVAGSHTFVVQASGATEGGESFVRQAETTFNVTGPPPPDGAEDLPLDEAWSLISFDLMPHDTTVPGVMSAIADDYAAVLGFDGQGYSYYPHLPDTINTLQEMDPYHGYWIKSTAVVTLPVVGPEVPGDTPLSLQPGWNLVSYLPNASLTLTDALSSIDGLYTTVLGYEQGAMSAYPDLPDYMNTLQTLERFHGYWIHMTAPATLVYPDATALSAVNATRARPNAPQAPAGVVPTHQWADFYGLQVLVDGEPAPAGTVVSVYDPDGVKVGAAIVRQAGTYGVLSVYGDDPLTATDEGASAGDPLTFLVDGQPALVVGPDQPLWSGHGERRQVNLWAGEIPFQHFLPLIFAGR